MGVNNRARGAAKRRKRGHAKRPSAAGGAPQYEYDGWFDERSVATVLAVRAIKEVEHDAGAAAEWAALLSGPERAVELSVLSEVMGSLLAQLASSVVTNGWTPYDLAQVVGRRLSAPHMPALAAVLAVETDRHASRWVATQWRAELAGIGQAQALELTTARGLELALGLCAVLDGLPVIATVLPRPGSRVNPIGEPSSVAAKQLARVRALLAKAESTEYDEEAEALSAKAQELISRYALTKLLYDSEQADQPLTRDQVAVRRMWIDPPYVLPKAMLIQQVASANRCNAVVSEQLGFSTVIGAKDDLDMVDLLATSLLVQADTALLRRGRHTDRWGTSRTRSFRRSFLVAYASRIGERLRATAADAVEETRRADALLPLLHRRHEQVDDVRQSLFPQTVDRETTVSNGQGWAAGRAAADLALLDADLRPITESA